MDLIWVILSLIGVLGLFFLLIYGLNKLNKKIGVVTGSKMRVLDRVTIGRDGILFVVSVGGKLVLMGYTPQHMEKICDLEMTPEEYAAQLQGGGGEAVDFSTIFASVMNKNKKSNKTNDSDEADYYD